VATVFGVGQTDTTGALRMNASIYTSPRFPGQAMATQLIKRQASIDPTVPFLNTDGEFWLDNEEVYWNSLIVMTNDPNNPHDLLGGIVSFYDQPGIPISVATNAWGNDEFKTYFRFKPDGDADNIYVTLGRANWSWHGEAQLSGPPFIPWTLSNWTILNDGTSGPAFVRVNTFPFWPATKHNFPPW
jgi:hypothetical protein